MREQAKVQTVMAWRDLFAEECGSYEPRLREAREDSGFTQGDTAEILGVSTVTVYQWERGCKAPRLPQLIRLSRLYGKPIDYLVGLHAGENHD